MDLSRLDVWGTGYLLLGMLSSLVFRAIRDAIPGNPAAQERILGESLLAMAIADVSHPHDYMASHDDLPPIHRQPSKHVVRKSSRTF